MISSIMNFVCDLYHKLLNVFKLKKIDPRKLGNNKKISKLVEDTYSALSPPQNLVFGKVGPYLRQSRYHTFLVFPSFSRLVSSVFDHCGEKTGDQIRLLLVYSFSWVFSSFCHVFYQGLEIIFNIFNTCYTRFIVKNNFSWNSSLFVHCGA